MKSNVYDSNRKINIGDVYLINFGGEGSVQQGLRPGVIFQNNTGNQFSPNIIALPLTTAIKKNKATDTRIYSCKEWRTDKR